jgi:hypothetical protein
MVFHHVPRTRNSRGVGLDVVGGRGLHMYICPALRLVCPLPRGQASEKDRADHAHVGCFFFFLLLVLRRVCRYPLVYSIMVIPKSVTRLIDLASHSNNPAAETMGFQIFYTLIGFVDVVVFFTTRRGLLLFGNDELEE